MMVPTLFAICLVVFIILNVAPGKPGSQLMQAEGSLDTQQGKKREAYKIFKEQFDLDKPVLFNTRFDLSESDIANTINIIANQNGEYPTSKMIKSQDQLEDWGNYSIPGLMSLLSKTKDPRLQWIIVEYLSLSARDKLIKPYADISELTEDIRLKNREIDQRNKYVSSLIFPNNASAIERNRIINDWKKWYLEHNNEYVFSTTDKIKIFFLDTRFAKYFNNLLHLDFGISHVNKKPVFKLILHKLRYSMTLSVLAIFFSYLIALPIGVFSATHQYSKSDKIITVILFILYSLPNFFVGTILLTMLSQGGWLHIFPTGGFTSPDISNLTTLEQIKDVMWHLVLPVACLTYGALASLSRYARTGLLEVIRSDYIRTARAKGLSEKVVIVRHAVRNGMIPILTLLASILPILIGGSVVIETIFNIPGIGAFVYESIFNRDYNVIMAVQLITAVLTLIGIFISDISYAIVDPRIKFK